MSFADSLDCVGIIGKDVTSASKVFGSFLHVPFSSGIFYIYLRRQQDALSVFDENDPTAARPMTREKARELCSEHMTEWAAPSNSNSRGDLTKLRIGIPQVCPQCPQSLTTLFDSINYVYRSTFRLLSTVLSSLPSAAWFAPSRTVA